MLGNPADPGVIPRSIDDIFNHIHSASPEKQFLVRISYMEIYNENLTDLLVEVEKEYVLDNFPFSFLFHFYFFVCLTSQNCERN